MQAKALWKGEAMSIDVIRKLMEEELRAETALAEFMERRKREMPNGSLVEHRGRNDRYYYVYIYEQGHRRAMCLDSSVPEHLETIKDLMEKKTVIHGLPVLKENIKVLQENLDKLKPYHPTNYKYGEKLGSGYYLKGDVCIKDWERKEGNQNHRFSDGLVFDTKSGIEVRSKSEAMIADALFDAGLRFKSETGVVINRAMGGGERKVYPDFEILHPKTNRLIWWEHMGRIHDTDYVSSNLQKILDYGRSGIIPGKNLIITYETAGEPLTRKKINTALRAFGLI